MKIEDLVRTDASQVKKNPELMRLYKSYYKGVFHKEPNCASCTFNSDFRKLKNYVLNLGSENKVIIQKNNNMKYVLKKGYSSAILSYNYKGATYRLYGRDIDDAFAEAFIEHAPKDKVEERKAMFEKLPKPEVIKAPVEEVKEEKPKKKTSKKK